jgi:DNA-binding transcriptional MerR regulator
MNTRLLRIGEVAKAAGISVDTVRHYERIGVLRRAPRTESGYRVYQPDAIDRVRLVRAAVQFGFSLNELARFMRARDTGAPPCRAVRAAAQQIVERIELQIAELTETRTWIRAVLQQWDERLAQARPGEAARLLEALGDESDRRGSRRAPNQLSRSTTIGSTRPAARAGR